jgi:hypothetical protein
MDPPFRRSILDSRHAVILDSFSEIFLWIGRRAASMEKKIAYALADKFLKIGTQQGGSDRRPPWVRTRFRQ